MYNIPAPTSESRAIAAELDKMAEEYAAILGENYRARKAEYFEKCRSFAEKLQKEGRITVYAGDCGFDALFDCIGEDKEHFAAMIMFFTDSENFYIMGACIKSTSLFRRIDLTKDDIRYTAEGRWGKLGVYFEEKK
jgi:hypothetical protein